MRFDVYCDESHPDLFASTHPPAKYIVIGSLWLPTESRGALKTAIHSLRNKHKIGGEFKWQKVSPSRLAFYRELVQWFVSMGDVLRFRCIAVEQQKVNMLKFHENDQELGFYKFYYQLLHQWIFDFNEYFIFCDHKQNRTKTRLEDLRRCLTYTNLSSVISTVQSLRSEESVLIQLTDVLTGLASAKLNRQPDPQTAKGQVIQAVENSLGHPIRPTSRTYHKFNVFLIDLRGGW